MAEYHTAKGTPYYPNPESRTTDCPVSVITAKSEELLNIMGRASRAHEASGASLFGQNLGDWPIWAVDVLEVIQQCETREAIAYAEAQELE